MSATSSSAAALVVIDAPGFVADLSAAQPALVPFLREEAKNASMEVWAFAEDPDRRLDSLLQHANVTVLDSHRLMLAYTEAVRLGLRDFMADLGKKLVHAARAEHTDKTVDAIAHGWAYCLLNEKNTGVSEWWDAIRLVNVQRHLEENAYARLFYCGPHRLAAAWASLAAAHGMAFVHHDLGPASPPKDRGLQGRLKRPVKRVLAALYHARCCRMARAQVRRSQRASRDAAKADRFLYSIFPLCWRQDKGVWREIYYGRVPELLYQDDRPPTLLLRLYDKLQWVPPEAFAKKLEALDAYEAQADSLPAVVLESLARPRDFAAYADPRPALAVERLVLRHPELFHRHGVDYGPILKPMLLDAAWLHWPNLQVQEVAARRVATGAAPRPVLLLYCYEYVFGKAVVRGFRQGAAGARILGMQHGPASPYKLQHMARPDELTVTNGGEPMLPRPDRFLLDGEGAAGFYRESGHPPEAISVTGPARFDEAIGQWESIRQGRAGRQPPDKPTVLVAPGHQDTAFVVPFALAGLMPLVTQGKLRLALKLHPKVDRGSLDSLLRTAPGAKSALAHGGLEVLPPMPIAEAYADTDVMLVTYSSVGMEAVLSGVPIVMLASGRLPDQSNFYGHPERILRARDAAELREAIHRLLLAPDATAFRAQYLEGLMDDVTQAFGAMDGQASERVARVVAQAAKARP